MSETVIKLPSIVFEKNLCEFIETLGGGNDSLEILVDFQDVSYYIPAAIVALITKFYRWANESKKIQIVHHQECKAFEYLQRIDFFTHCKIPLEERFTRHDSTGRFVPIKKIDSDTGRLSTEIATCIAPELAQEYDPDKTGFFDYIQYSVSELGNNVNQHSKGIGFASAQYMPKQDAIRVAIADSGIGILESFRQTGSPFWNNTMTEIEAIHKALEAEVSSKMHLGGWGELENAGVGLTLLHEVTRMLNGKFIIVSGDAYYCLTHNSSIQQEKVFKGTLCAFMFKRQSLQNFTTLLFEAKKNLGLIKDISRFNRLFT